MAKQITVIGSSGKIPVEIWRMAEDVGRLIAQRGGILITGGLDGVMEAASKGAKEAGGLTIGILPHSASQGNTYLDVKVVTEMSDARNVINVKSGDAVISIMGAAGTLSEIAVALRAKKRTIALKNSGGVSAMMAGIEIRGERVLSAESIEEAVDLAFS